MKLNLKLSLALFITIILWASAFVGIRISLESYSPTHLALLRYLVASSLLFLIALFKPLKMPDKKDYPAILLIGLIGISIYHVALNYGEVTVSASSASFIINAVPIFSALLASVFLKEKLKIYSWVGIAISFIGVFLILTGEYGGLQFNLSGALILIAAISQAFFFVLQKPYLKKYGVIDFSIYVIWAGTFFMLIFSPGLFNSIANASSLDTYAVVYLGIFPGVISYLLFAYVLSKLSASKTTSFIFLVPVATIFLSWVLINEIPNGAALSGGAVTMGGVYLFQKLG